MFYVFDGTFAAIFKGLSTVTVKTVAVGKEVVKDTGQRLLKLDMQFFSGNFQKLNDCYL